MIFFLLAKQHFHLFLIAGIQAQVLYICKVEIPVCTIEVPIPVTF